MNRLFKLTTLFATVISLSVLASEVQANNKASKKYTPQSQPSNTTTNGTSIFGGTLTNPPATSSPKSRFLNSGLIKAEGGLFNKPTTKPTFPYHVPPGGWKAIGSIFNHPTPAPTNPPKGTGMGHGWGFGGGSFGGGAVVGGTVVPTAAPVAALPAAPADAAAPATTESDADNAMQIAAGSTFTLKGEKFGDKAGRIGVVVGDVLIPAEVINWSDNAITLTLPQVGVGSAAKATFLVQRADGSTTEATSFEMVAAK